MTSIIFYQKLILIHVADIMLEQHIYYIANVTDDKWYDASLPKDSGTARRPTTMFAPCHSTFYVIKWLAIPSAT